MRKLNKEKIKFRASAKPQTGQPLSGVVWFTDEGGRGTCHIKFPQDTIDILARVLPYGLGAAMPGYIKVIKKPNLFEIWFSYLDVQKSLLLWTESERPHWCKRILRTKLS